MKANQSLVIGIDAVNIRGGGGLTHLVELLNAADPGRDLFLRICIWGAKSTLDRIHNRSWLRKLWYPSLEHGLLRRSWWQMKCLGQLAQEEGCDLLFVPGGSFTTEFRPVVTVSQNLLPFEWHELWRYGFSLMTARLLALRLAQSVSFRKSTGVIFLTKYARETVQCVTGRLAGKTAVIPHGIDSRFRRLPSLGVLGKAIIMGSSLKRTAFHLIYVSIVDQYKHQWIVVDAVARARLRTGIDFRLDLVGPAYNSSLRKLESALRLHDPAAEWVRYCGAVDYAHLPELYANADIGIFASSCENLPIILLEMMASQLPIACSSRGPMPQVLGDAGLYFDPEQPEILASVLARLAESEQLRGALASAAYEKAKQYSWDECARRTFGFMYNVACAYNGLLTDELCVG